MLQLLCSFILHPLTMISTPSHVQLLRFFCRMGGTTTKRCSLLNEVEDIVEKWTMISRIRKDLSNIFFLSVLGFEPWTLIMLGKFSTTEPCSQSGATVPQCSCNNADLESSLLEQKVQVRNPLNALKTYRQASLMPSLPPQRATPYSASPYIQSILYQVLKAWFRNLQLCWTHSFPSSPAPPGRNCWGWKPEL